MIDYLKNLIGLGPGESPTSEYDAAKSTSKRRAATGKTHSEEAILNQQSRQVLSSSNQDLYRNLSLAANAVRMHLNYNTQFSLQSDSGDDGFDEDFEAIVEEISQRDVFDIAGRHNRVSWTRLLECSAVLDGDLGNLKISSGHLQAIESDLIRNPDRTDSERWVNGILTNPSGRATRYSLYGRGPGGKGYEFRKVVPASDFWLHAHLFRFSQYRGVSPLTSATNDLKDFYEGKELALAKMKVEQLFAMVFYRDATESAGELDDTSAKDDEGNESNRAGYGVDFGKGPISLDLDDGDKAQFLKSDNPGSNTREFLLLVAMIALKSLDIPFSFFDEAHTNYSGSKTAWLHYERACQHKRENVQAFLNWWLSWRVQMEVKSGRLRIPRQIVNRGFSIRRPWWEFIPTGMPWYKPAEEVGAQGEAVARGFTSPQRVCRSIGADFKRNIKETARALAYANEHGISLEYGSGPIQGAIESGIQKTVDKALERRKEEPNE